MLASRSLNEFLLDDLRILDRWRDDDILAALPVARRYHVEIVGELQRVDHTQDLGEIAPSAGWISDHEPDVLRGIDDQERSHGRRAAGIGMNQIVQLADLLIDVGNDRELNLRVLP